MKTLVAILFLYPPFLLSQPNSPQLNTRDSINVNTLVFQKAKNKIGDLKNTHTANTYFTLPWLHRFLDTASDASIKRFLMEQTDSVLQLVNYESITAMHTFIQDNPYSATDQDGDNHLRNDGNSRGDDCDDLNPMAFPGNGEKCEGYGVMQMWSRRYLFLYKYHDEDCIAYTVAPRERLSHDLIEGDKDGDGEIDCHCLNYSESSYIGFAQRSDTITANLGIALYQTDPAIALGNPKRAYTVRGVDCNDINPAIKLKSQICINATTVAVCENGKWRYYPCRRCVVQPNETGVVVE